MFKKGFVSVIILITILLVAGIGGYVYFQSRDASVVITKSTITTTTTTISISTTTSKVIVQPTTTITLLSPSASLIKPEWLGEVYCDPGHVSVLELTNVYCEILVNKEPDALASESPVQLLRKNENGDWIILDEMFDDGMLAGHGDRLKGDRVYARVIEFYEKEEGVHKEMPLKILVTTSDNQQYTVDFNLNIISKEKWERSLYEMQEASDRAEKKVKEIMQSPPSDLESVAQILCDYLIEQKDIIADCEVSYNSVWITCNTGMSMEIWLTNLDEEEPPME